MTVPESGPGLHRCNVLGVRFIAEPLDTLLGSVLSVCGGERRDAMYLCPSGVHGVIEAQKDPEFRRILNEAAFNIPDGMPIVWASRALGFPQSERAFGPDVTWAILENSVGSGARHFFYGGKEGVADRLVEAAIEALPGLQVAGTYCPPFRPLTSEEEDEIAELINNSRADVVWVGLSTPKQERWIASMRERLDVKLICSVGAAFDYHTGSIKAAPLWMKRAALEWLYRLLQEPRRLWRRYFEIVPKFMILIALQLMRIRRFSLD